MTRGAGEGKDHGSPPADMNLQQRAHALRRRARCQWFDRPRLLLHQPSAQTVEFRSGDRSGFLQSIEFLDLVGDTEADHAAELITGPFRLLAVPHRHPWSLQDDIGEDAI